MPRENVLVTTSWLAAHLDDPDVRVVEVDEDSAAYYTSGHIPGAGALDWSRELQAEGSRDVVGPAEFAALAGARGIGPDSTVVLYGGNHNWFAAFAYWLFRYYGHRDVRLLDGGRIRWTMDGLPLVDDEPQPTAVDYPTPSAHPEIRTLREEVLAADPSTVYIDVRSVDEYSGRLIAPAHLPQEGGQQRGHIPGAVSIPWNRAVGRDGTFRDEASLREIYAAPLAAVERGGKVVSYCRIGERSSHTWFVLHELLGVNAATNYDGSWVEYGSLIGAPVERSSHSVG